MVTCTRGHGSPVDSSFCGDCGEKLAAQCGNGHAMSPGDRFCETCGSGVGATRESAPIAAMLPPWRFSLGRLTPVDRIAGVACAVLGLALFLPWFGVSENGFSYSTAGLNAHSYLALALLTAVGLLAYLAVRAGWDRFPVRLPVAHAPLLLSVGGVQLLLVLIGFLTHAHGLGHEAGSWLGLFAALGAVLPAGWLLISAKSAN